MEIIFWHLYIIYTFIYFDNYILTFCQHCGYLLQGLNDMWETYNFSNYGMSNLGKFLLAEVKFDRKVIKFEWKF